jgi:hypothetical protein
MSNGLDVVFKIHARVVICSSDIIYVSEFFKIILFFMCEISFCTQHTELSADNSTVLKHCLCYLTNHFSTSACGMVYIIFCIHKLMSW